MGPKLLSPPRLCQTLSWPKTKAGIKLPSSLVNLGSRVLLRVYTRWPSHSRQKSRPTTNSLSDVTVCPLGVRLYHLDSLSFAACWLCQTATKALNEPHAKRSSDWRIACTRGYLAVPMLHTPIWRAKRVVAQHLPPCLRGPALHADSRRPPGQARVANRQCSQGSSRTEAPRHLRGISMHRNWQAKQFPTAAVSVTSRASGAHWPPGWLVLRSSRQRQLHVHRWTAASMRAVSAMAWGKSCFPESIAKGSSVQSPSEKYKGSSTQRIRYTALIHRLKCRASSA